MAYVKGDRLVVGVGKGRERQFWAGTVVNATAEKFLFSYDAAPATREEILHTDKDIMGFIKYENSRTKYKEPLLVGQLNVLLTKDRAQAVAPVKEPVKPAAPVKAPVTSPRPAATRPVDDEPESGTELLALELESLANRIRKIGQGGTQGARFHPQQIKKDLATLVQQINKEI